MLYKSGITASLVNADRLFDDAKSLYECDRFPTSYALAILAEEEYSKAMLLSLVNAGAIPWSLDVRRALHDHVCKQLVTVILDYLSQDIELVLLRYMPSKKDQLPVIFPSDVLDAIHLICHERIPREYDRSWIEPTDRPIENGVNIIAKGLFDRKKQDAIYVGIGGAGEIISQPSQITSEVAKSEIDRCERFGVHLRPYNNKEVCLSDDLDSEKLVAVFKLLTGNISVEDFNTYWWARK